MQIVSGKERKIKMDKKEFALNQHEKWNGKIEVISRAKIETPEDLAVAYTPGVAEPCLKIAEDVDLSYKYTRRGNLVAVVTDGTAVLGLGDIGPEAGMPVMEGKWRCGCFSTLHSQQRCRRDRQYCGTSCRKFRRHQSGRYFCTEML